MQRRDFVKLLGGAAAAVGWSLKALAQRPAMTRVGVVTIQPRTALIFATFGQRLRELGYVEGQNLVLDFLNPEQQPGGNAGVIEEFGCHRDGTARARLQPHPRDQHHGSSAADGRNQGHSQSGTPLAGLQPPESPTCPAKRFDTAKTRFRHRLPSPTLKGS